MSRLQDRAQERVYAALLRLELNAGHLQFEIESNALKSKDFREGGAQVPAPLSPYIPGSQRTPPGPQNPGIICLHRSRTGALSLR